MDIPRLVVADQHGDVVDIPGLSMTAGSACGFAVPDPQSLVPLPRESILFALPSRIAVGFDREGRRFVEVRVHRGKPVFAAAAFLPPGYICTHHSGYRQLPGAVRLPLYCYAAVGWAGGKFYAAGYRIDRQLRHDIPDEALGRVDAKARAFLKQHPCNRLARHLVNNCVLRYRCPNACNLVLGRWECPVPVSRSCNAACIGCISRQPATSRVPSSQHRLAFTPSADEIVEYVVPHLEMASNPIASFGQGCEGEPLLEADLVEESIREIRMRTRRGSININSNGSLPYAVERLCAAGLNSMRVSLNSAQPEFYSAYYRPRGYSFNDVCASIAVAKRHGVWVSINYLVFPGFTDHPAELAALKKLLRGTGIDMIQTRNLNIDPAWYARSLGLGRLPGTSRGIIQWVRELRREFPRVRLGYYNPTNAMIRVGESHRS